jgi:RHS repeat-associated protein
VKKISSTETTVFVYNASGRLVAEYSTDLAETQQVSYLTTDHLGSPRVITDQNGTVTSRKDFSAFGEETITPQRTQGLDYVPPNIRQDYTGYQKDDESGLEFAQARYYNPMHGRFTSVDPLTASATIRNPQTFNRYSYVENSPISFKDPTGLFSNESVSAMARSRLEICWELGICGRAKLALEQRNARLESRSVCVAEEMGANAQAGSGCNKDCVKREKEKCYELGRDHFYENAIKYGVIDGLWFAGGVNTVYGMITGLSLWAVKRFAGFIGAGAGVIWGIRRAAIEGGEIEDECKKRIPEKCGKDCSG